MCVISDRHAGILSAMKLQGWNKCSHRYCIRHVGSNYNKKFKNTDLMNSIKKAASHFQKRKYKFMLERIEKVDKRAIDRLSNIPRCKWALAYDKGMRFEIMTTNSAESLNSMLSDFRGLLVTALVSRIFLKLVHLFDAHREFYKREIEFGLDFTKWCRDILNEAEKKS